MPTKRLYRSKDNRVIAGVAGGIAEYFNVDPTIIRLAFVILVFANGIGILAYFLAWLMIPEHPDYLSINKAPKEQDLEEKVKAAAEDIQLNTGNGGRLIGFTLVALGLIFLMQDILPYWFSLDRLWPIIIIVIGAWILVGNRKD